MACSNYLDGPRKIDLPGFSRLLSRLVPFLQVIKYDNIASRIEYMWTFLNL